MNASATYEGMAYLRGDKGLYIIQKELPNCPYEKCDELSNDKDRGAKRYIQVSKKDYKTAIKFLSQGVLIEKDPVAAQNLLHVLQKSLNWKDHRYEPYLVERLKIDLGIGIEQYESLFLECVALLQANHYCEGDYMKYQLYTFGAIKHPAKTELAQKEFVRAKTTCKNDPYYGVLLSSTNINKGEQ